MTLTPIRRRLQLSNISDSSSDASRSPSSMEISAADSSCMHVDKITPPRSRSSSTPKFTSPFEIPRLGKPKSPLESLRSPLLGRSPLKRFGFMVVRKRRATCNEIDVSRKKRTSSPLSRKPLLKKEKPLEDYVLKEDNLCSVPEMSPRSTGSSSPFQGLFNGDIIVKRQFTRKVNRSNSMSAKLSDSPISRVDFKAKRALSLNSEGSRFHAICALRERKQSVNDINLPNEDISEINPLMDKANLAGDFSRPLSLPVTQPGKHTDLKYITAQTLVDLLHGKLPLDFEVIDARYPYEFQGGHIRSAKNLYTTETLSNYFYGDTVKVGETKENRRKVIVFHCEFSSERGPSLLKHLRKLDRSKNPYPKLNFPELYLLKNGYKEFFEQFPSETSGQYVQMLDTDYVQELRKFRRKCKTLPAGKQTNF